MMSGQQLEELLSDEAIVRAGERVLVACSGGPDSVALAHLLATVAPRRSLTISLAYIHHATRHSAWQDEAVVLRIGASLHLEVDVRAIEPPALDEASLRDARYGALHDLAQQIGATAVATAHHAQDQTETVLLALFRGTGPTGLLGMPARRTLDAGVDLVRPLLRADPGSLLSYCHAQGLPYAVDPTNDDSDLRRNAIRAALYELRPYFPGMDEAVARAVMLVEEEQAATPRADLRRHVREVLRDEDALHDVPFERIEAAVRALERGTNGRFELRGGLTLRVDGQKLAIERRTP